MKAIAIILVIIAVIISVFYIPVYFDINLGKENSVTLGYLLFKIRLFPNKKKKSEKPNPKKKEKTKAKEKPKPKKETTSSDFGEILDILKEQLPNIKKTTKKLFGAIKIKKLYVNWKIAAEDAFETAMNFGKLNGVFYVVYGMLSNILKIEPKQINIYPNFLTEESEINVKMRVLISPAKIIGAVFGFAVEFLKSYLGKDKNIKEKAVN